MVLAIFIIYANEQQVLLAFAHFEVEVFARCGDAFFLIKEEHFTIHFCFDM